MKYIYSVIRFVPDPIRAEFVNVGVLVGSDESSEWELRTVDNLKRARSLDDKGLLRLVWSFIDDIGRKADYFAEAVQTRLFELDDEQLSEDWLAKLSDESKNLVQFTTPAVIVASDVDLALDILFEQFIVEIESRKFPFKKKTEALAAIRRAYRTAGLLKGEHFSEGANVKGQHHKERFDFVVANGRAIQLAQTWSFQVPDQDNLAEQVKAWAWTVSDIRKHGGEAETFARRIRVPNDVDIEVVYVPPTDDGPRIALDEALAAFKEIEVRPVEAKHAIEVGVHAKRLFDN